VLGLDYAPQISSIDAPGKLVPTVGSCGCTRPRRILAVLAVASVLGISAWADREWLLRSLADLWIVSDPIGPADAVAVFGGGHPARPLAAAQYYRQGLVKKILVDLPASEAVLLELGIPGSAIETFGNDLRNTHEEVLALRAWAERHGIRSVVIPTEVFSTRRVRWMLHRALPGDFAIRVIALDLPDFRRDDWWRHNRNVAAFKIEVIKYLYYMLKY
jgi:uncharacterized SAM-binding protein YcdF (DUF218 family)